MSLIRSEFGLDPAGLRLDFDRNLIDTDSTKVTLAMATMHAHGVRKNGRSG